MTKRQPEVDEADVDDMIALMTPKPGTAPRLSAEERADLAFQIALGAAKLQGTTPEYANAFATRVRQRMLWIKVE